jgi:hypothetical protein
LLLESFKAFSLFSNQKNREWKTRKNRKQNKKGFIGSSLEPFINRAFLPLIKDNDEPGFALVLGEIRPSREDDEFCSNNAGP